MLTPARCATRAVGMLFTARSPLAASMATGSSPQAARVTIDLSYGEQMSAQEHKSLARQLRTAYGLNLKAEVPLSLHLISLGSAVCRSAPSAVASRRLVAQMASRLLHHRERGQPLRHGRARVALAWATARAEPCGRVRRQWLHRPYIDRTVNRGVSLGRAKEIGVHAPTCTPSSWSCLLSRSLQLSTRARAGRAPSRYREIHPSTRK